MAKQVKDPFGARAKFDTGNGEAYIYRLSKLEEDNIAQIGRLPFSPARSRSPIVSWSSSTTCSWRSPLVRASS